MVDLTQQIAEKQAELRSLQALNNQIITMTKNFEHLEDNMSNLSQGTESIADIMVNWQKILKSISMASLSLQKYSLDDYDNFEMNRQTADMPLPETMVRFRLDD